MREYERTSSFYTDITFIPNFVKEPKGFLPPNRTNDVHIAFEICNKSYQCRYDYGMTFNNQTALLTRKNYESVLNIKEIHEK